jgi:hypothetical protein
MALDLHYQGATCPYENVSRQVSMRAGALERGTVPAEVVKHGPTRPLVGLLNVSGAAKAIFQH